MYAVGMTKYDKKEIIALRAAGKSYLEITEITGAAKATIAFHCGEKVREKSTARARKAKKILDDYKESLPCSDCKNFFPFYVTQFDHLPEFTKVVLISSLRGCKWETIEKELAKCELVCANCHAIRTWTRAQMIKE
jgi:hypothetical protein